MNKDVYIVVKDSKNNYNIWTIIDERQSVYIIKSRTTRAVIEKERCFHKDESSLLYYDGVVDIKNSDIQLETKKQYRDWKRKQKQKVHSFRNWNYWKGLYEYLVNHEGDDLYV